MKLRKSFSWLIAPTAIFAASRLLIFLVTWLAARLIHFKDTRSFWHAFASNSFFDLWARWDSAFYVDIARHGYYSLPGHQSNLPFYPFYPLTIKLLGYFIGNYWLTGWLIANVSFLLALILLYVITSQRWGEENAERACLFLSIFPTSFFFSAVYSESLFLLLSLLAYWLAGQKKWFWAGLAAALATLTRITGLVLVVLLFLLAWPGVKRTKKFSLFLPALFPILALLLYMAYLQLKLGDPLAFWHGQALFGRQGSNLFSPFIYNLNHPSLANIFELIVFFVFFVLSCLFVRLDLPLGTYAVLLCLFPLFSGSLSAIQRFVLPIFPAFIRLGMVRNKRVTWLMIVLFAGLLALMSVLFTQWIFVG